MKKSHLRSITWIFLLAMSLSSYAYLKSVPVEQYQEYATENTIALEDQDEREENKILLPDVALVKKIIDVTKIIFHGK